MADLALDVRDLTKRYGTSTAVDGISFSIPRGSVMGLLGPNGAGKTTTIQMLTGITDLTSGDISYFGIDFRRHRRTCLQRINTTSAYSSLQGKITVRENLRSFAMLYGVADPERRIQALVERFEIGELLDLLFWNLSAGQRTRVNLAKALLNDPELLLLDEPTASLDPDIRDKVMTLIEELRAERSISILYTSHNMDEVHRICDEVVFLDRGRVVKHDTPAQLAAQVRRSEVHLVLRNGHERVAAGLRARGHHLEVGERRHDERRRGDVVLVHADAHEIAAVIAVAHGLAGGDVIDVEVRKPTLEDVFLEVARGEV